MAILDYLKRYQPDDNEAYTMVALKFTMYRDIAGMLVSCGYRSLKHLKDKSLGLLKSPSYKMHVCIYTVCVGVGWSGAGREGENSND